MNHRTRFYQMHHQNELLLLPNTWDVLSAMILAQSGFEAIGTTSWGIANSLGKQDGELVSFEQMFAVVGNIIDAVDVPVTVDMEAGYGKDGDEIVANVLQVAGCGAAGINIEDSYKDEKGLKDIKAHCELLGKIKAALERNGFDDFYINARTDTYLQLSSPLTETLERAKGYAEAGADGIFVPGLSSDVDIKAIVGELAVPLNVMSLPNLTDADAIQSLGVKRLSIGNALSDACIAFVEQQAAALKSGRSTACLYDHKEITTRF